MCVNPGSTAFLRQMSDEEKVKPPTPKTRALFEDRDVDYHYTHDGIFIVDSELAPGAPMKFSFVTLNTEFGDFFYISVIGQPLSARGLKIRMDKNTTSITPYAAAVRVDVAGELPVCSAAAAAAVGVDVAVGDDALVLWAGCCRRCGRLCCCSMPTCIALEAFQQVIFQHTEMKSVHLLVHVNPTVSP